MPIAVRLTGAGVGGIAVIRVGGDDARPLLARVTAGKSASLAPGQVRHLRILSSAGETVDDAVVVCVDQAIFELHVHGGTAVVEAVMNVLQAAGARRAQVPEALGDHAEVTLALSRARTMTAARLLAAQIDAGIPAWARTWLEMLDRGGELWRVQSAAQWLLARSETLEYLLDPPRIAIVGPPNAGKSTLANSLLGRQVAITSATAGTTRDWVDAAAVFSAVGVNVEVVLVDTAGVRESADALEIESIARTHQQARSADAIILLFDGSRPISQEERGLLEHYLHSPAAVVAAINKSDLAVASGWHGALAISAKQGTGLSELMQAVLRRLDLAEIADSEPFAFSRHQREALEAVAHARTLPEARKNLSQILKPRVHT